MKTISEYNKKYRNKLFLCSKCNKVYERFYSFNKKKLDISYYSDFPKYGQELRECDECS